MRKITDLVTAEPYLGEGSGGPRWWDGRTFVLRLTDEGKRKELFFHGYSDEGLVDVVAGDWKGAHPCLRTDELADELEEKIRLYKGDRIYECPEVMDDIYWFNPCTLKAFQASCREHLGAEVLLTQTRRGEWAGPDGRVILVPIEDWYELNEQPNTTERTAT